VGNGGRTEENEKHGSRSIRNFFKDAVGAWRK
jgi:hypothetical protein